MNATNDILDYLGNDATLTSLLSATAQDPKIYLTSALQEKTQPYIIYTVPADGTLEELLKEFSVEFRIVGTYKQVQNIDDRLEDLLDLQDGIKGQITSSNYIFRWSKKVSGRDLQDPETRGTYRAVIYDFKVHKL